MVAEEGRTGGLVRLRQPLDLPPPLGRQVGQQIFQMRRVLHKGHPEPVRGRHLGGLTQGLVGLVPFTQGIVGPGLLEQQM